MEIKLEELEKAVEGFVQLVDTDFSRFENEIDAYLIDAMKNGMVQKFEYSTELCWKTMKKVLLHKDGVDSKTPKQTAKDFFLADYIKEDTYLTFCEMMDDRNRLSHIYKEETFNRILSNFDKYADSFKTILSSLRNCS